MTLMKACTRACIMGAVLAALSFPAAIARQRSEGTLLAPSPGPASTYDGASIVLFYQVDFTALRGQCNNRCIFHAARSMRIALRQTQTGAFNLQVAEANGNMSPA